MSLSKRFPKATRAPLMSISYKVLIELVDAEGNVFTAQTVTFHSPGKEVRP